MKFSLKTINKEKCYGYRSLLSIFVQNLRRILLVLCAVLNLGETSLWPLELLRDFINPP
jgi:hypothetical protein